MKWLVDANVLSEATRRDPDKSVLHWLRTEESEIAIDPIILGELKYGILILPIGRRRTRLEVWFDAFVARIEYLTWDASCGHWWGELVARLGSRGRSIPIKDSLIAATAVAYDLTVVTRNVKDFAAASVPAFDPFNAKID